MGGCRGCRWFEVRLSRRELEDSPYIFEYQVEMIGRSVVRGETDRVRVETTTSPHAVIDFLALGPPAAQYVNKTARKALHEAGDLDQGLADALDDFDSVVAR